MKIDTFIQNRILRPIRLKPILQIINQLPAKTILDIGCMDDYILKRLNKKFEYLGIDKNPLCKHPSILKEKIEYFPDLKEKFDIVIATEILEHISDPVSMIEKIKLLSTKFIIISVPNEPFFSLGRLLFPAKEHLWTIFPQTLKKHLGEPIFETTACFKRHYIGVWQK